MNVTLDKAISRLREHAAKYPCAGMSQDIQVVLTEIERLQEWTYDSLSRILQDELPLTMTLGLVKILIERMTKELMFVEPIDGVVSAVRRIAEQAGGGE